jgi:hypothetical protein
MRRIEMAWSYEVRGSENRLVEIRSGFATEDEARAAGSRAKRLIDCVCYPNLERLTLVIKEGDSEPDQLAEMPNAPEQWFEPQSGEEGKPTLKYPWQQLVLDAFMEPRQENLLAKINLAERAISSRLLDPAPCALDERLAVGESLLALRRLLAHIASQRSTDKASIA